MTFTIHREPSLKTQNLFGAIIIASAPLTGCTAVPDGTPQEIALSVAPEMAKCDAYQHGALVGSYDQGRKTIALRKSRGSADIFCSAPGYKDMRVSIVPDDSNLGGVGKLIVDFGPINYFQSVYPKRFRSRCCWDRRDAVSRVPTRPFVRIDTARSDLRTARLHAREILAWRCANDQEPIGQRASLAPRSGRGSSAGPSDAEGGRPATPHHGSETPPACWLAAPPCRARRRSSFIDHDPFPTRAFPRCSTGTICATSSLEEERKDAAPA